MWNIPLTISIQHMDERFQAPENSCSSAHNGVIVQLYVHVYIRFYSLLKI